MKFILFLTLSVLISFSSLSQDILTKKNGDELQVKVTEITMTSVKYRLFDNLEGPVYTLPKSEVFSVKYPNGAKDVFSESTAASDQLANTQDLYARGYTDAGLFYNNYKGAATGTLVVSLISPLAGLIPAVICSSTKPGEHTLGYTNPDLLRQPNYRLAYTQRAKKIKSRKVWTNWGIGFGVNIIAALVLINNQQ